MSTSETLERKEGGDHSHADEIEQYGEIGVRHGIVNRWLMVVYIALFAWSMYYLFAFWGGLGPGLAY